MLKKYSDYIEISPNFESVVDIGADTRKPNLWRDYIVGENMEKMVEVICQSLNNEGVDMRRSFWAHGSYGTGKSYAAILIKHLMEEKPEVIEEYLSKTSRLSRFKNRFMKFRNKGGDFLVIWKTGCTGIRDGNAMLMEAEKAIRDALAEKFGDKADYGDASLADAVKEQIHSPVHNWEYILNTTTLGDDYGSVEELQDAIDSADLKALQRTAAVIRKFNWGLVDSLETFRKWVGAVIENNHLDKSGIFFIWDEFTEYILNSDDITILQQLSEFTKVKPLYMMFIVHKSQEMITNLTTDRYQLITHRFHQVEFHISQDAALDLISGSINIRNGMEEHWKDERKPVIKNIRPFLPDMAGLDDNISEKIEYFCPIHPMTIKLLSRVAENYAASQRTMFRFMKDQSASDIGFIGYINKYGPDDQACWLTPDWLWDYFFTRESDFSEKETKVPEYIRHFEESRNLVENDDNAFRVFKTALLLMALMSSTKGLNYGKRTKDGIAATEECLATCLAGVMDKTSVHDLLETMQDSKILILDRDRHDNVRLQLPFNGATSDEFPARLAENDKKYNRYKMFSKDGEFAQALEKRVEEDSANDVLNKRMKIVSCCAETLSINTRLAEITKELEKYPYKLGLLIVTVNSDAQGVSIQSLLQSKAQEANEPRLTIALLRDPFTDENRTKWLTALTKQEMASASGQTGSVNQYRTEAATIMTSWVSSVVSGGRIIAYNGSQVFNNHYGMAQLRKTIRSNVLDAIFPYAPENIVVTNTAYKSCNESAPTAGVQRKTSNSQLKNVINSLQNEGVLELSSIDEMEEISGNKAKDCIAALAKLVKEQMESGSKVNLSDLWTTLQNAPYGYYDTIACGILLGYVFSCYKNSKYTWTDSAQSPQILAESTISRMIVNMCKSRMTTDYLSAGSVTWQHFSEYLEKIMGLTVAQVAEQTTGYHNAREAVTKSGSPFWVLKYLPDETWSSQDLHTAADKIIDNIQVFISQDGDVEAAMSDVLQLMNGRGRVRKNLETAFKDKNAMSAAFRTFLFSASPDLKAIATKLDIQPQELSDKLHSVMQGAIYTWTEGQVNEKLADVVSEYNYLEAVGNVLGKVYHSLEAAKKDLMNQFNYLRISISAIEMLAPSWYSALQVLHKISEGRAGQMTADERQKDIELLLNYGKYAKDCLTDGKSVLSEILTSKGVEYTSEELSTIYDGLKGMSCNATLMQFEKELDRQMGRISFARNKVDLQEIWKSVTGGIKNVKEWCTVYEAPIMWIIPKELQKAITTVIEVQKNTPTVDAAVLAAIDALKNSDTTILNDKSKVESAFLHTVGDEFMDIWATEHLSIISKAKIKLGNDMSTWSISDLTYLQRMLRQMLQEKAKKEKLSSAKNNVRNMKESVLKDKVADFLDAHPEFCDNFIE